MKSLVLNLASDLLREDVAFFLLLPLKAVGAVVKCGTQLWCGTFLSLVVILSACGKSEGVRIDRSRNVPVEPSSADVDMDPLPSDEEVPQDEPVPESNPETTPETIPMKWDRYEPDSDWHSMFEGVAWRVFNGYVEVKDEALNKGSTTLVGSCLQSFGAQFEQWSVAVQVKMAHLYATAVTESGCRQLSGSGDGLSTGILQVTGSTCAEVMKNAYSADACKQKMADDVSFSIEVGTKYMGGTYQTGLTKFTPVPGQQSDLGLALNPPKVAAAYNAGALKKSTANRWHLVVTADHIDRYVAAYNAFVEYTKQQKKGIAPVKVISLRENPALPQAVASVTALKALAAQEGDAVFVGDWSHKVGDFYYYVDGAWRAASAEW